MLLIEPFELHTTHGPTSGKVSRLEPVWLDRHQVGDFGRDAQGRTLAVMSRVDGESDAYVVFLRTADATWLWATEEMAEAEVASWQSHRCVTPSVVSTALWSWLDAAVKMLEG